MCAKCDRTAADLLRISELLDFMADDENSPKCKDGDKYVADMWRADAELLRDIADTYNHNLKIDAKKLKVGV